MSKKEVFEHPFDQVMEFHKTYGCLISDKPQFPSAEERKLRMDLLKEEYEEYLEAEATDNLVEIGDSVSDLCYIAIGTAISYGIPLDVIFNEVHQSNMSKLGENGEVLRRADGKILKGPNFFRPKIAEILEQKNNV